SLGIQTSKPISESEVGRIRPTTRQNSGRPDTARPPLGSAAVARIAPGTAAPAAMTLAVTISTFFSLASASSAHRAAGTAGGGAAQASPPPRSASAVTPMAARPRVISTLPFVLLTPADPADRLA